MKNVVFIMPFLGNTGAEKVIFNIIVADLLANIV